MSKIILIAIFVPTIIYATYTVSSTFVTNFNRFINNSGIVNKGNGNKIPGLVLTSSNNNDIISATISKDNKNKNNNNNIDRAKTQKGTAFFSIDN